VRVEIEGWCCFWFCCLGLEGSKSGNLSDDVLVTMDVRFDLGLLMRGPKVRSTAVLGSRPFMRTSR